ncbi:hypothetical protein GCM10028818_17500 [Spirosoma horti]
MDLSFFDIGFGHVTNTQKLGDGLVQRTVHPVSLWGKKGPTGWLFQIYQSGFREELLPSSSELAIKNNVATEIRQYMDKATQFTETDFIQRPQLWVYYSIGDDVITVTSKELK